MIISLVIIYSSGTFRWTHFSLSENNNIYFFFEITAQVELDK